MNRSTVFISLVGMKILIAIAFLVLLVLWRDAGRHLESRQCVTAKSHGLTRAATNAAGLATVSHISGSATTSACLA